MKVKPKPLPPLSSLDRRKEEEEEEMAMRELVANTNEDKDGYYFEDPSNISKYITTFRYSLMLFSHFVLFSDISS